MFDIWDWVTLQSYKEVFVSPFNLSTAFLARTQRHSVEISDISKTCTLSSLSSPLPLSCAVCRVHVCMDVQYMCTLFTCLCVDVKGQFWLSFLGGFPTVFFLRSLIEPGAHPFEIQNISPYPVHMMLVLQTCITHPGICFWMWGWDGRDVNSGLTFEWLSSRHLILWAYFIVPVQLRIT